MSGPYGRVCVARAHDISPVNSSPLPSFRTLIAENLCRQRKALLIQARNDHVKEGLRRAYQERIPGGHLPVFCVSNSHYERYSKLGLLEFVQSSEIPQLRNSCYTVSAAAQLAEAHHFLQAQIPRVLNEIDLWVAKQAQQKPVSQQIVVHDGGAKQLLEKARANV